MEASASIRELYSAAFYPTEIPNRRKRWDLVDGPVCHLSSWRFSVPEWDTLGCISNKYLAFKHLSSRSVHQEIVR